MILQTSTRDPAGITLRQTGQFQDGADIHACRTIVPYTHRLNSATLVSMNAVTEGTVEVGLRFADEGANRSGSVIGLVLENDDLKAVANAYNRWSFDLRGYESVVAPEYRQYFVVATATDWQDRLDELTLLLDVTKV